MTPRVYAWNRERQPEHVRAADHVISSTPGREAQARAMASASARLPTECTPSTAKRRVARDDEEVASVEHARQRGERLPP